MKTAILFVFCLCITAMLQAQISDITKEVHILMISAPPEIDGVEEAFWDAMRAIPIDRNFLNEKPTISAYWKAAFDVNNIYVLVNVEDDDHYPAWEKGSANYWEYDHVEVYFDVNNVLIDGLGAKDEGTGHYRFSLPFNENGYNKLLKSGTNEITNYAYSLTNENYVVEYVFPIKSLKRGDGIALEIRDFIDLPQGLGFDITVVDRDEGTTTSRQRCAWANNGAIGDSWQNMDSSGVIFLSGGMCSCDLIDIHIDAGRRDKITLDIVAGKNTSWIAGSDQAWLTVSPVSGIGSSTIYLSATENPNETERSAYVTITGIGQYPQIYTIIQGAETNGIAEIVHNVISLYPNPAAESFSISGLERKAALNISDISGKLLLSKQVENNEIVAVSSLASGVYLVRITTSEGSIEKKLVKR